MQPCARTTTAADAATILMARSRFSSGTTAGGFWPSGNTISGSGSSSPSVCASGLLTGVESALLVESEVGSGLFVEPDLEGFGQKR